MRIREVLPDRVRLSSGLDIPWEEVRELKVSNDTLRLTLADHSVVTVSGLDSRAVDSAFLAWSRQRRHHPANSPTKHVRSTRRVA